MIEKLTRAQEARFQTYVDKWIDIGLRCNHTDRERAEKLIRALYVQEGLAEPEHIVWFGSPIAAARWMIEQGQRDPASHFLFGQHDASWLSYYDFFRQVLGLTAETEDLGPLFDLAECCGWWAPFSLVSVCCDQPVELHTNDEGDLHNPDGPALRYNDGEALYAVNGVQMPGDVIDDHSLITVERIDAETNAERRRILLDLYGTEAYLVNGNAEVIDTGVCGTLYRREVVGDEPIVAVRVRDTSTLREYFLRVPPTVTTAKEAVAWTFGLEAGKYKPLTEA